MVVEHISSSSTRESSWQVQTQNFYDDNDGHWRRQRLKGKNYP